jgi:hypothetical protein
MIPSLLTPHCLGHCCPYPTELRKHPVKQALMHFNQYKEIHV